LAKPHRFHVIDLATQLAVILFLVGIGVLTMLQPGPSQTGRQHFEGTYMQEKDSDYMTWLTWRKISNQKR